MPSSKRWVEKVTENACSFDNPFRDIQRAVGSARDRDADQAGQALTDHLRQIQHNLFGL